MNWVCAFLMALMVSQGFDPYSPVARAAEPGDTKLYTNARFGFSVRYPGDWRLGNPMPDGIGVSLYPPVENSQIVLSGFMNPVGGSSQDRRQTLDEFAAAHRRIMTELYDKKKSAITWQRDQDMTPAGFPAKRLAFPIKTMAATRGWRSTLFHWGATNGAACGSNYPPTAQPT